MSGVADMPPYALVAAIGKRQATCSWATLAAVIAALVAARVPAKLPIGAGQSAAYWVSSGGTAGPSAFGVAGPALRSWAKPSSTGASCPARARVQTRVT